MLYLRRSQIPGAGLGLYTDSLIKKGENVVEYFGEIVSWDVCEKRSEEGKGGYVFHITDKYCIDAYEFTDEYARYANDAAGLVKVKGLRNNAAYEIDGKRVFIVATRNIKPGEEVFVSYGKDYWKVIKTLKLPKIDHKGKTNLPKGKRKD